MELCFKKSKKQMIFTETIRDIDNTDDKALLANTPAGAESLLHSLKQAVRGFDLTWTQIKQIIFVSNKKEQSQLSVRSLKLVDNFTYLGKNISSTESDIGIWRAKASTTIEIWLNKKGFSKLWKCRYYWIDAPNRHMQIKLY